MKRLLLVFNPKAGQGAFVRSLYPVIDLFSRAGYEVVVHPTAAPGDAQAYVQKRCAGFDLVVCSGGDGIVYEVVNAYMHTKSPPPPLGYIPAGTTNDFATSLGLPRNIMEAAHAVLDGQPRLIDVGKFGSSYFSYVAAFGLFTDIAYSTPQGAKNIWGRAAYLFEGIKQLGNVKDIDCAIDIDGKKIEGRFALGFITNASSVAGFRFHADEEDSCDDGLFEAVFICRPENVKEHSEIIAVLTGTAKMTELMVKHSARRIVFTSDGPYNWTLDGEFGGQHTTVVIENLHRALNIIAPGGKQAQSG